MFIQFNISTAPAVPANGSSTVQCVANATAPTTPSVTDVCGNSITPTLTSTVDNPSSITCNGTRTYTYTYTDCANLSTTWKYVYTIQHSSAPVVPSNGASTVQCVANATAPSTPSVTDVCGNSITPTLTSTVDNPTPINCNGTRTYTYTYTDCANLSTTWKYVYTIQHSTAPVVPSNGASTVQCVANATAPSTPSVTDVCGNSILPTLTSTVDNPSPITCNGTRTYTYTYTDCANLSTTWKYVYTIQHSAAPVVPANGSGTVQCVANATAPTTPSVTDVCGNSITPTLTSTVDNPSPITCNGTRTYTYTYTDCANLSTTWKYVYTIQHSTTPVVPVNGSGTVQCVANATAPTTPSVTDVCGNSMTPTLTSTS